MQIQKEEGRAEYEGMAAGMQGRPRSDNPHVDMSCKVEKYLSLAWDNGYDLALEKRRDANVIELAIDLVDDFDDISHLTSFQQHRIRLLRHAVEQVRQHYE